MRIFCVLILLILIPGAICVSRGLPPQTNVLIAEKYAGWSGVLRVWLCEGWAAGRSIAGWINASAAVFERTHDGVFIQVTIVDSETLARLPESGLNLPDLILFPTGALNAETPLDPESPVRPIALGGYLWAINRTLIARRSEQNARRFAHGHAGKLLFGGSARPVFRQQSGIRRTIERWDGSRAGFKRNALAR